MDAEWLILTDLKAWVNTSNQKLQQEGEFQTKMDQKLGKWNITRPKYTGIKRWLSPPDLAFHDTPDIH